MQTEPIKLIQKAFDAGSDQSKREEFSELLDYAFGAPEYFAGDYSGVEPTAIVKFIEQAKSQHADKGEWFLAQLDSLQLPDKVKSYLNDSLTPDQKLAAVDEAFKSKFDVTLQRKCMYGDFSDIDSRTLLAKINKELEGKDNKTTLSFISRIMKCKLPHKVKVELEKSKLQLSQSSVKLTEKLTAQAQKPTFNKVPGTKPFNLLTGITIERSKQKSQVEQLQHNRRLKGKSLDQHQKI